jgi:hypothetical protein
VTATAAVPGFPAATKQLPRRTRTASQALSDLHTVRSAAEVTRAPIGAALRAGRCPGRGDVERDLVDQLGLALERRLVAEPIPELHNHALPVQVAVEVE